MITIRLPQFGMGMSDGTIIAWHKKEGELVVKGEPLCDIEAAKTTVEYESPATGLLARIVVKVDENVPVDAVIAEIDPAGAASSEIAAGTPTEASSEALREEADVPPEAKTSDTEGSKASPLAKRIADRNRVDLADVSGSGARGRITSKDVLSLENKSNRQIEPRARRAAKELDVDLDLVDGSGPGGRVVEEDVRGWKPGATARSVPPEVSPAPSADGYVEIPHSMMRRTIARRLTESKSSIPHFYVRTSCRLDAMLALRQGLNAGPGEKVSVNDLIVRAVALALMEVPDANVQFEEKVMRRYAGADVAVAVATPRGLVTPIVRAVQAKSARAVAAEVKELAARAKEGKLKPEEYTGGHTSVSNLGMFGVEEFSAILNPPQSSIFAIGAGEQRVIPDNGAIRIATMMTVTASFDHRAIDGAVGAQLMASLKKLIENPDRLVG